MTTMRELAQKATPGPWMLADSCSWRRILTARHEPVCVPTIIDSDNHPDLLLHGPKGMHDNGPFIAACSPERILAYEDCADALRRAACWCPPQTPNTSQMVVAHPEISSTAFSVETVSVPAAKCSRCVALAALDALEEP